MDGNKKAFIADVFGIKESEVPEIEDGQSWCDKHDHGYWTPHCYNCLEESCAALRADVERLMADIVTGDNRVAVLEKDNAELRQELHEAMYFRDDPERAKEG